MAGFLHSRLVRAVHAQRVDLSGRRIIVTGTAPGSIGFETARILASWGADLVVTTRSNPQVAVAALRAALGQAGRYAAIDAHPLDLAQAESVRQFLRWYLGAHGEQLDVLINNAGVHLDLLSQWKRPRLTADGYEIHWRTNYLGTAHLTHLLLPALVAAGQARGDARIVNVVSRLHARGSNAGLLAPPARYNSWDAYGRSKLALVHATFELQRRHAQSSHLQAYCLHPGAVLTNIADKGLAGNPAIETVRKALAPVEALFLLTPEEGAQTSVHCATHPQAQGGLYYERCRPAQPSREAGDAQAAARLWDSTQAWLQTL